MGVSLSVFLKIASYNMQLKNILHLQYFSYRPSYCSWLICMHRQEQSCLHFLIMGQIDKGVSYHIFQYHIFYPQILMHLSSFYSFVRLRFVWRVREVQNDREENQIKKAKCHHSYFSREFHNHLESLHCLQIILKSCRMLQRCIEHSRIVQNLFARNLVDSSRMQNSLHPPEKRAAACTLDMNGRDEHIKQILYFKLWRVRVDLAISAQCKVWSDTVG